MEYSVLKNYGNIRTWNTYQRNKVFDHYSPYQWKWSFQIGFILL